MLKPQRLHRHTVVLRTSQTTETDRGTFSGKSSKTDGRCPELRNTITKKSRWIHGSPWVQAEVRRRGPPAMAGLAEVRGGLETNSKGAKKPHHKSKQTKEEEEQQEKAGVLIDRNCKHEKFQEISALVVLLKACGKQKDLCKGSRVHADILKRGMLKENIYVGNTLINMYAKCGEFAKARQVFDELIVRDVVSWNALVTGYTQHGHDEEALNCFAQMQKDGVCPDAVTFACVLKACGSIRAAEKGEDIHAKVAKEGLLQKNIVLANALMDMYAKCSALVKARQVFDELPVRDVVSWNVLIAGYIQHGHAREALKYFERMQREGLSPNAVTFACILKACGNIGEAEKGEEIHAQIIREGLLAEDIVLCTALLDMYATCGELAKARQVFDELPVRDIVSWNALIAGYTQHGHAEEALKCFDRMQCEGLSPNAVTFACILKACGSIGAAEKGEMILADIVKMGLLGEDVVLGNAMMDMYAKCGALAKAQQVFDELPIRNVASWNALITGYVQLGLGREALELFGQMQSEDLSPDVVTFVCILKACGNIGAAEKGEEIHAQVVRAGLLGKHTVLGNALLDMYAKCGALIKAQQVFNELPVRDVVSWNALISGYTQHEHGEEALNSFERMQREGFSPNTITFACILKACGSIGEVEKGKEIHVKIAKEGLLEKDVVLGTSLLDMYATCGALVKAQQVFDELPVHDVVSCNALIAGYTQHGHGEEAVNCFERMKSWGLSPDAVTYTCIVDLFGRSGHFDKVTAVIKEMPSFQFLAVWFALLSACQTWGNTKLGRLAFEHAVQLDEKSAVAYICMSNIYATIGLQNDADKIEAMRIKNDAWKKPARSWWTDLSGNAHSFCVADESHLQSKKIYTKLYDTSRKILQEGYCPNLHLVSEDIYNDTKRDF